MKYKLANDIKAIIVYINNYNFRNLFPNLKVKTSHRILKLTIETDT